MSPPPLTPKDRDRLVKLVGMLGSEHDGEVLAAARKATALLKEAKLTWADVVTGTPAPQQRTFTMDMSGFDSAMRAAAASFEEMARQQRDRYQTYTSELDREKAAIAQARLRLDRVLARETLDSRKRMYFESIRAMHQARGYINPTHRQAIDREFFKGGWDEPVGRTGNPEERVDIRVNAEGRRYFFGTDGKVVFLDEMHRLDDEDPK